LVKAQIKRALMIIDPSQDLWEQGLQDVWEQKLIRQGWQVLTQAQSVPGIGQKIDCGFKANVQVEPVIGWNNEPDENIDGYTSQCGLLCAGLEKNINDVEGAKNALKTIFNGLLTIVNDQFAVRYQDGQGCMYDPTRTGYNHPFFGYQDGWFNGVYEKCSEKDKCSQIIINIHRNIAKFEDVLGDYKFPNLDRDTIESQMRMLTGKDEEDDFSPHLYDDLYRQTVYGFGALEFEKGLAQRKKDDRLRKWQKDFPSDPIDIHPDERNKKLYG